MTKIRSKQAKKTRVATTTRPPPDHTGIDGQMHVLHHTFKNILGDGNCLFYAVAFAAGLTDRGDDVLKASFLRRAAAGILSSAIGNVWRIAPGMQDTMEEWSALVARVQNDQPNATGVYTCGGDYTTIRLPCISSLCISLSLAPFRV